MKKIYALASMAVFIAPLESISLRQANLTPSTIDGYWMRLTKGSLEIMD